MIKIPNLKNQHIKLKLKCSTHKKMLSTRSIYKIVFNHLSVILEDKKRFNTYFKKKFPKSFKYLPMVKFVLFLLILLTLKMDYETYSVFSSTILEEESSILAPTEFYSTYLFCFYCIIIVYEYVLSIYVTLNANSLESFYETDDDDISTTPVIKESPIKRRHSEPLPRRSNRPAIQRRNTR